MLRDFLILSEKVGAQVNLGGSLHFSETLSRHMKWKQQGSNPVGVRTQWILCKWLSTVPGPQGVCHMPALPVSDYPGSLPCLSSDSVTADRQVDMLFYYYH